MRTLITESQLSAGVSQLAHEIDTHYQGRPITVVAVLPYIAVLEPGEIAATAAEFG